MGAMNTFYKVGFWWGMLVLILDISKGAAAVAVTWQFTHSDILQLIGERSQCWATAFLSFLNLKGERAGLPVSASWLTLCHGEYQYIRQYSGFPC